MRLVFLKILGKLVVKSYVPNHMCLPMLRVHLKKIESAKDYQMMLMLCFSVFPDFLYKSICCGYSFELH